MFMSASVRRPVFSLAVLASLLTVPSGLDAQSGNALLPQQLPVPLREGDVAITGFAGSKLSSESIAPGIDPLERTIIDLDGATLRIYDLTTLGGPTVGQVVNAPIKLAIPARDIGHVFGLVFDDGVNPDGTRTAPIFTRRRPRPSA